MILFNFYKMSLFELISKLPDKYLFNLIRKLDVNERQKLAMTCKSMKYAMTRIIINKHFPAHQIEFRSFVPNKPVISNNNIFDYDIGMSLNRFFEKLINDEHQSIKDQYELLNRIQDKSLLHFSANDVRRFDKILKPSCSCLYILRFNNQDKFDITINIGTYNNSLMVINISYTIPFLGQYYVVHIRSTRLETLYKMKEVIGCKSLLRIVNNPYLDYVLSDEDD